MLPGGSAGGPPQAVGGLNMSNLQALMAIRQQMGLA
jgi:hypothetical protein